MLLFDAPLTFSEFMTHEDVPLADVFREVLTFLRARPDAVLFGAQAVNAYCDPPRMTADIDVLSTAPVELADAIRAHIANRFHIAMRVREAGDGAGLRVYQLRKPKNRHLVDVRGVSSLPPYRIIEGVRVIEPGALAAMKASAIAARSAREKGLSDRLDLTRLLRTFPELRAPARITELSHLHGLAGAAAAWTEVASTPLEPDPDPDDDD
ncbi:MAG: hypothetical protein M3Y87_13625 [Myxococcota bacterium]|nr:hypothetical protein [Myxococcota bacterium]